MLITTLVLIFSVLATGVFYVLKKESAVSASLNGKTNFTVVIDAGHGGIDGGTQASNGALDRVALAKLVFEGEHAKSNLEILNAITHKCVWEETDKLLKEYQKQGKKAAVIDAPALFLSKIFVDSCDFIISVLCDKESRINRIIKRDNISREKAKARINAQPSDEFFIENSDYYITNHGAKEEMNEKHEKK